MQNLIISNITFNSANAEGRVGVDVIWWCASRSSHPRKRENQANRKINAEMIGELRMKSYFEARVTP